MQPSEPPLHPVREANMGQLAEQFLIEIDKTFCLGHILFWRIKVLTMTDHVKLT